MAENQTALTVWVHPVGGNSTKVALFHAAAAVPGGGGRPEGTVAGPTLKALEAWTLSAVPQSNTGAISLKSDDILSRVPRLQELDAHHLAPPQHRHRLPSIMPSHAKGREVGEQGHAPRGAPPARPNGLIYPTDYGADPTGHADSTEAFGKAMAALLNRSQTIGRNMSSSRGVACADMGGATLHLAGGDYLISEPIVIPCHVCNMRVHGGTLRASSSFPPNATYMIESGFGCAGVDNAGSPEFIGFSELLIDCQGYAAGGMNIFDNLGTNIGPRIFVTGFSMHGISIQVGHEVMVHETVSTQALCRCV